MEIRKGRRVRPLRVLIYGSHKVGKTTFGASAKDPIIIGNEDGADNVDADCMPAPASFEELKEQLQWLYDQKHGYRTIVLDTLDWLEPIIWTSVCRQHGKAAIEDFGYGKGYVAALDLWREFLRLLELCRNDRDMNVIALAHAAVRTVSNPSGPDYDRWELKVHKSASALWSEWVDVIGFAHVQTVFNKEGKGTSAGRRVVELQDSPAWVAGSRFPMPERIELDYRTFAGYVLKGINPPAKEEDK